MQKRFIYYQYVILLFVRFMHLAERHHQYNTYGLDNIGNKYLFPIKRVDFYAKKYREFDFLMYFCRKFYTNTLTMTSTMRDFMKIPHGFFRI